MAPLPLAGIRVLDFTWVVAGPVATRLLADFGAEVIKLERKPGPPGSRQTGLQGDLHRNKRSIAVNMAHPRGVEIARRLAALSDVVIDNFSARVMRSWGMDYASLQAVKPDIICVSMSGLGHSGPRANYVSYGPTLQALSGFTLLMRDSSDAPVGYGYSYADMVGGYTGALATLMALRYRQRTGCGQFVDLAQFEALVSVIGPSLLEIAVNGRPSAPPYYRSQEMPAAPHGVYRCRARDDDDDRWIALSVQSQAEWERFVKVLETPAWSREPRFQTLYLRMKNQAELDRHIEEWTRAQVAEEAMALLQRAGIAAGVVNNGADLCARNPQLGAREFWGRVPLPDGSSTQVTGIPARLSRTPGTIRTPSPLIGSANEYVLGELLGYDAAARARLIDDGAVWA
ncbi:MAG TPA: CoA transferase [Candidatus Binataceae bacterium]|nr:CoA transferase [Candidatus Binataceae bacterium]